LPLTAILYVAAKEQPDVTSRQLNSLALVCNWSIRSVARLKGGQYNIQCYLNLFEHVGCTRVCSADCIKYTPGRGKIVPRNVIYYNL